MPAAIEVMLCSYCGERDIIEANQFAVSRQSTVFAACLAGSMPPAARLPRCNILNAPRAEVPFRATTTRPGGEGFASSADGLTRSAKTKNRQHMRPQGFQQRLPVRRILTAPQRLDERRRGNGLASAARAEAESQAPPGRQGGHEQPRIQRPAFRWPCVLAVTQNGWAAVRSQRSDRRRWVPRISRAQQDARPEGQKRHRGDGRRLVLCDSAARAHGLRHVGLTCAKQRCWWRRAYSGPKLRMLHTRARLAAAPWCRDLCRLTSRAGASQTEVSV
jgi:hypothetical protein